jgi:ELWxxDGT repeat protein
MIKNLRLKCLLLATALTVTMGINAQNVKLVKDVNPNTDANPSGYTLVNGTSYFTADDGIHGTELWRTDGTAAGTSLVKDITPGASASFIYNITLFKGKLFFIVANNNSPQQLWSSDGTDAGTQLVKNITTNGGISIETLAVVDSLLYFVAGNNYFSEKLWKSDGTSQGTQIVADFYTPAFSNGHFATNLTGLNGVLYFSMHNNDGELLWRCDGTTAGTIMLKNLSETGTAYIAQLTPLNGLMYFSAFDAGVCKLWVTNGTAAGTKALAGDITKQLVTGAKYMPFSAIKHTIFCFVNNANGTLALCSYNTDVADSLHTVYNAGINNSYISNADTKAVNDSLLFFTTLDGSGNQQLWVTKGNYVNSTLLKTTPYHNNIQTYSNFTAVGPNLFFINYDKTTGIEPWVSDGTVAGTHIVKDIFTGIYNSQPANFSYLSPGVVLFTAADGKTGFELWRTDGNYTTASIVKDINKTTTASGFGGFGNYTGFDGSNVNSPHGSINNNGLLFVGYDFAHGSELWKTDGTASGTFMLKDVIPGGNNYFEMFNDLQEFKNEYFYFPYTETDTTILWKTDGTQTGSVPVDTFPSQMQVFMNNITPAKTKMYLVLQSSKTPLGAEFWVSDGVTKAHKINRQFSLNNNAIFLAKGDSMFFVNRDSSGTELWVTNGTNAGTHIVKDIYPGMGSSTPCNMTVFNGKLYFNADDGGGNNYLWVSDGSATGTQLVKKVKGTFSYYSLGNFTISNKKFYLWGDDGTTGYELWVSDGTNAGTRLVKDIYPGLSSSTIDNMVDVNGTLFFTANDGVHGTELWKTNGTDTGTVMVKDITTGAGSSTLKYMINGNGLLYFVLNDTLWQSNGTTTGTHAVNDAGLSGLSNISSLMASGNRLYFGAYSYQYGYELYVMGANSTLPVTMLSFTGQWAKNDAQLNWVTANELNSSHFNIQRSLNGTAFTTIGQVKAQGTTSSTYHYNYTDANAASLPASSLYYRLQQVDLDGNATYSNLVRLLLASNNTITIAPNPAHKAAYIISSATITGAAVTIADMAGHTVYSSILNLQAGTQVPLNIAGVPAGVYNVTIQNGLAIKQQSKLVVQ